LNAVDKWGADNGASRSEAFRRLLDQALAAQLAPRKAKASK
jgi:hypothetical protein